MPKLQVLNGKRQGEVFDLRPNQEMVVGHRHSAAISIDDPWVSWDHARLIYQKDTGHCWIEDLGSTNGTYVNCVRIKRQELRHEDIVFLGKTHVIFLSPVEEDPLAGLGSGGFGLGALEPERNAAPFGSSSASGPFASSGGLPPLQGADDPFASRSSQNTQAPLWEPGKPAAAAAADRPRDPFSDSSVDPFSSGPDYSGGNGGFAPLASPSNPLARGNNPFAETRGDDQAGARPRGSSVRSLSLSGIAGRADPNEDPDDFSSVPNPSPKEISRLIEGNGLDSDLFAGDLEELDPLPAPQAQDSTFPIGTPDPFLGKKPSEMRTQPIDTEAVNQLLEEHRRRKDSPPHEPTRVDATRPGTRPPPPPPVAAPPGSGAVSLGAPSSSGTPPFEPSSGAHTPLTPGDAATQAFDRARMQDEVRRIRMALEAAKQQNPHAVAAAAQQLRDQELGRLAQRVAELERDLAGARAELQATQSELDEVTAEMIDKEDLIDSLRDEVQRLGGSSVGSVSGGADEQQDWSSLEF